MRILVVTQYFWPENFRINELTVELAKRGHEVTVLTGEPTYPRAELFKEHRRERSKWMKLGPVEIVRVPIFVRRPGNLGLLSYYLSFALNASLLGPWKLRRRRIDVVLVFQPSPVTVGLPAIVLGKMKGAPLVFWVQDLWPDTLEALGVLRSRIGLSILERAVSLMYAQCDHLLAQSNAFIPRLREQGARNTRISYFPNWAQNAEARPTVGDPEPIATKRAFNVFYLGNVGEAQDFEAVLEAVKLLAHRDDIHWNVVGDGSMAQWLREEVQRLGLKDRVSLLGSFPPEEMPAFHRRSDALLVSLKADPLFAMTVPSKVQSYLAAGRPILAMLDGEGARVVTEAGAGLTCPAGDSAALARAVEALSCMTPSARAQMGAAGMAYCQRHFSFEPLVDRLEQFFRESTGVGTERVNTGELRTNRNL